MGAGSCSLQFFVFCDESGNTGPNYWDEAQPVYVAGGFLLPETARSDVCRLLTSVREKDTQLDELKASTLLKNRNGREIVVELLDGLGEVGCVPVFMFSEKRQALAAKLLDVFCDPFHNSAADWLPTSAIQCRRRIGWHLSDLSDELLREFAQAYKSPDVAGFERIVRKTVGELEDRGETELAETFRGCLGDMEELVEAESYDGQGHKHYEYASLNLPLLAHVLRACDRFLDRVEDADGRVFHDEQLQFEDVYNEFFRNAKSAAERGTVTAPTDEGPVRIGLRNLTGFETGDSEALVELQAADLLAGTVRHLVEKVLSGESWDETEEQLASRTLVGLYAGPPKTAFQLASVGLMRRISERVVQAAKDQPLTQ